MRALLGGAGDLVSKVISRVIIGVTPFGVLITLLITYLLSPVPLQVGFKSPNPEMEFRGFRVLGTQVSPSTGSFRDGSTDSYIICTILYPSIFVISSFRARVGEARPSLPLSWYNIALN